jgi:ABC-type lipoprotein release transport system permease subunit
LKTAFFIARRYLVAKKSRQIINVISAISAIGIALGTMALVVVLSVYNGFDNLVKNMYNAFDPDLIVKSSEGKTMPGIQDLGDVFQDPRIDALCPVIEETVFLQYRNQQAVARMKGVDSVFMEESPLQDYLTHGRFSVRYGELEEAVVGRGLARNLGLNVAFIDPLWMYYPKRDAVFSPLNPMASLSQEKLFPSGIFSVEQRYDSDHLLVSLETARKLLDYGDRLSHIEIRINEQRSEKSLSRDLKEKLGDRYTVLTRYQQNETLYKMMTTEKIIIFVLLGFILLIISCNVLSSLSMLILEKKEDIAVLGSMGARPRLIRQIFITEGWLISIMGWAAGMIAGLLLCFIQSHFGLIALPGSFMVTDYPVAVQWSDMVLVSVVVLGIGFLAAYAPVRAVFSKAISLAYPGSSLGVSR